MPPVIYGLVDRHAHMHTWPHESDFKKPGAWWAAAGVRLV